MEDVYDLSRYTYCAVISIGSTKVGLNCFSTSARKIKSFNRVLEKDAFIAYDKEKKIIRDWGDKNSAIIEKDDIKVDKFMERMNTIFKKDKSNSSKDDNFLLKAVSDFIRQLIEKLLKVNDNIKGIGALHYVFVVPSEWEEEIRDSMIRSIFVEADLISKFDHKDRLLFRSDLEALCYNFIDSDNKMLCLERGKNTLLCRLTSVEGSQVILKLDLVTPLDPLFNFSGSLIFTKIVRSKFIPLTLSDIKIYIKEYIKSHLPVEIQEEIIDDIVKRMKLENLYTMRKNFDRMKNILKEPLISNTSEWELNTQQKEFIKSINIFNICSKFRENLSKTLLYLLPDSNVKKYTIFTTTKTHDPKNILNCNLTVWSKCLLEYCRTSLNTNTIVHQYNSSTFIDYKAIISGASRYAFNAIQNSSIYSKPRIISVPRPSIFLNSKPDAIMSIDITLESTLLSFLLLDKNGITKTIYSHKDFMTNSRGESSSLRSLGSFFSFEEDTKLTIRNYFFYILRLISFVEKHFGSGGSIFCLDLKNTDTIENNDAIKNKDTTRNKICSFCKKHLAFDKFLFSGDHDYNNNILMKEIKDILCSGRNTENNLISIQQNKYIKAFIKIYMIYITKVVSKKLKSIVKSNGDMKIGYAVTIEKFLLQKLFGTEDDLRNIIYKSGLIKENDGSKKLRIIIQGEGLLPVIQQSCELQFKLKSFFVIAQLHVNHVQLTLNQVITESNMNETNLEYIVIQHKVIPIPNLHDYLCTKIWNTVTHDYSLIQLCENHANKDNIELLELFTLKNKKQFMKSMANYVSKQVLGKNSVLQYDEKTGIKFSTTCLCKIKLKLDDILEISFRPALQDIISLVSTSLINKQLFKKYRNIYHLFHIICFNFNSRFQPIFMKILQDETNQYMYEQKIDISHHVIPNLWDRLFQPVLEKRPLLYKAFQVGVLHHVFSKSYGFSFDHIPPKGLPVTYDQLFNYKNKSSDKNAITFDNKTVFLLFKKGDRITSQTDRRVCLSLKNRTSSGRFCIQYFKLANTNNLTYEKTLRLEDTLEKIEGPEIGGYYYDPDVELHLVISIGYDEYSSSFSLLVKVVGDELQHNNVTIPTETMTLAHF